MPRGMLNFTQSNSFRNEWIGCRNHPPRGGFVAPNL
jgi:hypothetical protein